MGFIGKVIGHLDYKYETFRYERKDARVPYPILVLESDDWGSIRMPSIEALQRLKSKGYHYAEEIGYDRFDTLESKGDLDALKDVLCSVKDSLGCPARMTMNYSVANPDFNKIESSVFESYYYEPFTYTLKRQQGNDNTMTSLWNGIKEGVFQPQFHGREHLNVQMWMNLLRKGNAATMDSFYENVFSMIVDKSADSRQHVMAAYNISAESEYELVFRSISEGLSIFERVFGYKSESMVAPCYTWDREIEKYASDCGIKFLQGARIQRHSALAMSKGMKPDFRYTGERNRFGQIYTIRNCSFEPSENASKNADFCLSQIYKVFKRGQAAIISSHRQNYIGGLNIGNRDSNLEELGRLLATVVAKFPDVRFMSSDQFGEFLRGRE